MAKAFIILGSFLLLFCDIQLYAQDAEIVEYKTQIQYTGKKLVKKETYVLKINNRRGDDYTQITIPYQKTQSISKLEGSVYDANGKRVSVLNKKNVLDRSAYSRYFYVENMVKEFSLRHSSYPFFIEYSYETSINNFYYIDFWSPVVDYDIPTYKATLEIETSKQNKIKFTSQLTDSFRVDTTDKTVKYKWEASFNKQPEYEVFAPDLYNYLPKVIVVPSEFEYVVEGSQNSWEEFCLWQSQLLVGLQELPIQEQEKVREIIKEATSLEEKVHLLYNWLQDETRYVNITINEGGMLPYSAKYVAENKYGDCKALANYFRSVLQCAGIPSYYTLIKAGRNIEKINRDFPSQQFNHAILCVPNDKDTLWVDCTSDEPFHYLGLFDQNREVLVIKHNDGFFTRTPGLTPEEVKEVQKFDFCIGNQEVTGSLKGNYRGYKFEYMKYAFENLKEKEQKDMLQDRLLASGYTLEKDTLVYEHRDSTNIHLNASLTGMTVENYGNELLVKIYPMSIPNPENPDDRTKDVQIDYPVYRVDTLNYKIPAGYGTSGKFENCSFENQAGSYSCNFSVQDNNIQVVKQFKLHSGEYSLVKYQPVYELLNYAYKHNGMYIILNREY